MGCFFVGGLGLWLHRLVVWGLHEDAGGFIPLPSVTVRIYIISRVCTKGKIILGLKCSSKTVSVLPFQLGSFGSDIKILIDNFTIL